MSEGSSTMTTHGWSWSDNVKGHEPELMGADDFDVKERAFPFKEPGHPFIAITPEAVTFKMQRGPILEVGINGCQIDDILTFAGLTIAMLNEKFSCPENADAVAGIQQALAALEARRRDRVKRDVEGLNKA